MIALIARLLGVQTLAASLIVYGVAAALAGASLWGYGLHKYNSGYSAGEAHERADWQERQRLARIAEAADAKSRQADIDAAAQAYADQQRADDLRIASLQQALRDQKDEDNVPPDPAKPAPVCRAGISARVSTQLDAIGR
jgi:hypothetical protein